MLYIPDYNTAGGVNALGSNTSGFWNTAFSYKALDENTTGSRNTAIGTFAGANQTTGSNNIYINHSGVAGESYTTRIGENWLLSKTPRTFIGGIYYGNVGSFPATIYMNSNGQLGHITSSKRYKEEIEDMGEKSSGLMQLRPVTFRYTKEHAGDERPVLPGLIAEEVAEVYPDLVLHDSEGEVMTVQYHKLIPMLLNEVQKQNEKIAELMELKKQNQIQEDKITMFMERLSLLESERALNVAQTN